MFREMGHELGLVCTEEAGRGSYSQSKDRLLR